MLPHCAHEMAQITRSHNRRKDWVRQLSPFYFCDSLGDYLNCVVILNLTMPSQWPVYVQSLLVLDLELPFLSLCRNVFLLFLCLIFMGRPTYSCSFLAWRTFFSWVTLWKTSKAVSLPHFSHLISSLCSIAWKWSTCYSQGGHRHRRGQPDLVYLEAPAAKGSRVSIQTGFIHYKRH